MLLKGSAVPLGLGTIDPCCWSGISLPEMTSLLFMLSLPGGEMPLLNDWLKSAPPSQPGHNTIYIPYLSPRPRKYRSFLKWLRVVTYLLDYKSKRTMYSLCFTPHTLNKKKKYCPKTEGGECAVSIHRLSEAGIKNAQSVMIRALKRVSNESLPSRIVCAALSHIACVFWIVHILSEFGSTRDKRENKGMIV